MTLETPETASRLKSDMADDSDLSRLAVVHFRPARTYIHADQYFFDFDTGLHWYVRSSTGYYGNGVKKYSWPYLDQCHHQVENDVWASYLRGKHESGEAVVPFFNVGLSKNPYLNESEIGNEADKYLFVNRVSVCPLCGKSDATDTVSHGDFCHFEEYYVARLQDSQEEWNRKNWSHDQFCHMRHILQRECTDGWRQLESLVKENKLHTDFIVHSRCRRCREKRWGFRDAWKYRHDQAVSCRRYFHQSDWDDYQEAKGLIEQIWPEDFKAKPDVRKAIFRHARKRARIKPLSRGELAFFSMHLAASQVKELKATNRTHDTNKILNQAN
jgi:hypothetical protein